MSRNALEVSTLRYAVDGSTLGPLEWNVAPGEIGVLRLAEAHQPRRLLDVLATLQRPVSGNVLIAGHDSVADASGARRVLAFLPEDGGFDPEETAEEHLARVTSWRGLAADARADARARFTRWTDLSWPDEPLGILRAGPRLALRVAVAVAHRPALLIASRPLDLLPAGARPTAARFLASCAADGVGILLWDGSAEASLLADRLLPGGEHHYWVDASWDGDVSALERESLGEGLPGRWRVGVRAGACRLGPFTELARARDVAHWVLAASAPLRQFRIDREEIGA